MHRTKNTIPLVAIVGKPNVGKSSIFNRLIKKRKAIISEEPGVTRDINYETVTVDDVVFRLADTAGFTRKGEDIPALTRKLNNRLIEQASLILFTCDVRNLDSEDFEITRIIRKSGKPYIFIINKVDNDKLMEGIYDFFDLGFENPLPISAIHGKNICHLKEIIGEKLREIHSARSASIKTLTSPAVQKIHVAIVGKPNVGKSSLLNLLVNSERSLVTPYPGTTRNSIDETISYRGYEITFVDTAGIRKRTKIRENVEFYSLIRAERAVKNSTLAVLLLDAQQGITNQDKKIASLIVNDRKGLIIAVNKWDLASAKGVVASEYIKDIYYYFPHISFAEVIPVSAKTGYNKIKLLKKILIVYNNYNNKVKTSELNSLMRQFELHGTHIKYGFQKSIAPPIFEFFVSRMGKETENFRKYIMNSIRKNYNFDGVPIEVHLRKG
jgi:GTP-binding protein